MKLTGYNNGYNAAIEAMKAALKGQQSSSPSGPGVQSNQLPALPMQNKNNNGQGQSAGQDKGQGKLDNKSMGEVDAADTGAMGGGWISQELGAKLAKRAGYGKEDCGVDSNSKVSDKWIEASQKACSQSIGSGMGNIMSTIDKLYKTSTDWKRDLRNIVGKALSRVENRYKWGKKQALAVFGEIKKYTRRGEHELDHVIYCIDTSGSVSDTKLHAIVSEAYSVSVKKGIPHATYVMFDDGISQIEKLHGKNTVPKFKLKGRGGTDWWNLFDGLNKEFGKKKCPLVMVFTDTYLSDFPTRLPWMDNLVWVIYDNSNFGKNYEKPKDVHTRILYMDTSNIKD